MIHTMDGALLRRLLINGYRNLKRHRAEIDELNVFPIPDGDTGKNMMMTYEGGVVSMEAISEDSAEVLLSGFAKGTLLSARGNSGVILSQFFRGFAEGAAGKQVLAPSDLLQMVQQGAEKAYGAVLEPVEGTMLTVMRESRRNAAKVKQAQESVEGCLETLLLEMERSLAHTPELLPVLKESGVVDSGGAGLVRVFEGMLMALRGEMLPEEETLQDEAGSDLSFPLNEAWDGPMVYGYCTEFVLRLQKKKTNPRNFSVETVTERLASFGDSIVAVQDGSLLKVHVHTFAPENVLAYGRSMGEFLSVKIENMDLQHSELHRKSRKKVKYAVVAVASGKGIVEYFKNIGVTAVVDGGQTNNPSVDTFLRVFRTLNAEHILVLPNDSNVVMTAQMAAQLYSGAQVHVLPTRSVAEGFSALTMMDLSLETPEAVIAEMTHYLPNVTTAYVTVAVRDSAMNGVTVRKGDYIGLTSEKILSSSKDLLMTAEQMLERLPDMENKQVLTAFCGGDVTEELCRELQNRLEKRYPLMDVALLPGGQDVYSFIFAIE